MRKSKDPRPLRTRRAYDSHGGRKRVVNPYAEPEAERAEPKLSKSEVLNALRSKTLPTKPLARACGVDWANICGYRTGRLELSRKAHVKLSDAICRIRDGTLAFRRTGRIAKEMEHYNPAEEEAMAPRWPFLKTGDRVIAGDKTGEFSDLDAQAPPQPKILRLGGNLFGV